MSIRLPEPDFLRQWREWILLGPPKCCHTCEHYDADGICVEFIMAPPKEFIGTVDACDKWEREIPF